MPGLTHDPPRRPVLPESPDALLGRDHELAELGRMLAGRTARLITLSGPPGVGKTRLALAAAAGSSHTFADGVAFVDLAPVRDADLVPAEIAAAIGPTGAGSGDPADADLLLVLDNLEHLIGAAPHLAALLTRYPRLVCLVTSRERLHLRAEQEVPVAPLALPGEADLGDPDRLAGTPAVAVLVQRVRAYQPDFRVTADNQRALAEICTRLDGLPLALELAAARLRLFTPDELTFRLRHRLGVLSSDARDTPERHRTLRSALSWSHDLLTPQERTTFHRLSVFAGGWTLAAAEAVCATDDGPGAVVGDVVGATASLVDKSLVRRSADLRPTARFAMLESLREFATELLDRDGGTADTRSRHAGYYAVLAAGLEARVGTAEERSAIEEVGVEAGNLRAALEHCLATGRGEDALRLAGGLGWYAYTRGQLGVGQDVVDRALAAAGTAEHHALGAEDAALAAKDDAIAAVVFLSGAIALARGDVDLADAALHRSLALADRAGTLRRTAIAEAFLGHLARARGRADEAVGHHQRAGLMFARLANAAGVAWSRYDLGLLARHVGDVEVASAHLRAALSAFRDVDYGWAVACCAWALGTVELRRDRGAAAAALLAEALDGFEAAGDGRGVAQCLEAVAALAGARGAHLTTSRLLGSAAAARERLAAPMPEEEQRAHDPVLRRVRRALGPDAADRAGRAGRRMPAAEALAAARAVLAEAAEQVDPAGPLTPREHEVADLVRRGCTNRQIGRALGISEKTAEVHVHHIIRKLGASSRAEIAAWVASGHVGPGDVGSGDASSGDAGS